MSKIKATINGSTFSFNVPDAVASISEVAWFNDETKEGWVLDQSLQNPDRDPVQQNRHGIFEVLATQQDTRGNKYSYLRLRSKSDAGVVEPQEITKLAAEQIGDGDHIEGLLDMVNEVMKGSE